MSAVHALPQLRRPGRPPVCPPEIVVRIIELQRQGLSYRAISEALNREGVPTPAGRPVWAKSQISGEGCASGVK